MLKRTLAVGIVAMTITCLACGGEKHDQTLLLGAGADIRKVQELLGHRHITTTQIYDKRRIAASESASHDVPI